MSGSRRFQAVKTKRAFEEVCDQIRASIQAGDLVSGDKLPAERDLAEQFSVSRATVREALRTLEFGGVLRLYKGVNGGAVVMQGDVRPITQTIADLLSLGGLSLRDYMEARVSLQKEIIRLACERGTDEDFDALAANVAQTRALNTPYLIEERTELTLQFYALLAMATKNRAMEILMAAVTEPLGYYIKQIGVDRRWDVAASREAFLGHLRNRDAQAAIAEMVNHMDRLHSYMLSRTNLAEH